jgi:hypothetical protein
MAERSNPDGTSDAEAPATAPDDAAKGDGPATPVAADVAAESSVGSTTGKGSTATATRPVVRKTEVTETRGHAALTAAGRGIRRARNVVASIVWLVAVLCAAILAVGALFTALSQTNESNEIVQWVLARGEALVGPFGDLFKLETAKNTVLVNWGVAAVAYLVVGKIAERLIRP